MQLPPMSFQVRIVPQSLVEIVRFEMSANHSLCDVRSKVIQQNKLQTLLASLETFRNPYLARRQLTETQ